MTADSDHGLDASTDTTQARVKTAKLRIRVRGACVITAGRTRIKPDSAVLFALALYLGVRAGERLTRAEVLDLLWPGVESTARRHALRQLLYRLKRAGVGIDGDGDELSLALADVDCDLTPLLGGRWYDDVAAADIPSPKTILPSYLPNVTELFHEWIDQLRTRCGVQIRLAALRHVAAARREGRWVDVERLARLCLETDPLNEEATLALAEAIAMSGSKAEAVRLLDAYLWEIGDREKNIAIPARVLRRRISEQPVHRAPRAGEPPLIARADDIAWLNARLDATSTGRCGTAMLLGPPGIGKTAVMRAFVSHAEMRGWRFVESRLQPSDIDRPMSVFVELFPPLLKASGALGASPESLAQLRRLVEHHVVDDILANKSQEAEAVQARIRTSAVDLLKAVTHEGPLVVVLEDLHWIDKQSLRLLTWILEHATDAPVLWLLTARMEGRLAELREALPVERVPSRTIESLQRGEAMTLFRACVPEEQRTREHPRPELVYDVTGGNPLFIREVAGHWAETGATGALPGNLKTIMRGRVARLTASAQRVLHCCAVLGRFASVPRVTVVLEISTTELLACIEEVDGLGLLGLGGEPGSLALHDLWQEELISTLGPATLALLHLRCGEVLAEESADTKLASATADAARHLISAGAKERALRLLHEAATLQMASGLSEDAAAICELALAHSGTREERERVLPVLIEALQHSGAWHRALQLFRDYPELVPNDGRYSTTELARLEALWRTGTDTDAALHGAIACAEDRLVQSGLRLRACLVAARCAANQFDAKTLERAKHALNTITIGTERDSGLALSIDVIVECEIGSLSSALAQSDALVANARSGGDAATLAKALRFASYPRRAAGEFASAVRLGSEAFEVAAGCQLVEQASLAGDVCATVRLEQGDLPGCEEWLDRADQWAKKISPEYGRRSLALTRTKLLICRGDFAAAQLSLGQIDQDVGLSLRERLATLEVRSRILTALCNTDALSKVAKALGDGLIHSRERMLQDSYVGAYVIGLGALGRSDEAHEYAKRYAATWRRHKSPLPAEIRSFVSD